MSTSKEWTQGILKAASASIPRGRRRDYKPFWNSDLEKMHNELSDARDEMEEDPSNSNTARHNLARTAYDELKTDLSQSSWKEKTDGLNIERGQLPLRQNNAESQRPIRHWKTSSERLC